ncbi:hypothetical protein TrLO_g212 [Triparma laevis f. longispina]|nr:hypothetical protein TrLO_g212 [Triparma laevis f. longispina]
MHSALSGAPSPSTSLLKPPSPPTPLPKSYPFFLLFFSTFFWLWAILNTITESFDLGVASFLTVILSSYTLLKATSTNQKITSCQKTSSLLSSLFVSLNYGLGYYHAVFTYNRADGFVVYCGIFTVLWFGNGVIGLWLMRVKS